MGFKCTRCYRKVKPIKVIYGGANEYDAVSRSGGIFTSGQILIFNPYIQTLRNQ